MSFENSYIENFKGAYREINDNVDDQTIRHDIIPFIKRRIPHILDTNPRTMAMAHNSMNNYDVDRLKRQIDKLFPNIAERNRLLLDIKRYHDRLTREQ